jgi:hypothetical protein
MMQKDLTLDEVVEVLGDYIVASGSTVDGLKDGAAAVLLLVDQLETEPVRRHNRSLKRECRKNADRLGRIKNLTPGRKVADDLERIALALELGFEDYGKADADLLRRLAARLRQLRVAVRGAGRDEQDQAATRATIAAALDAGLGAVFAPGPLPGPIAAGGAAHGIFAYTEEEIDERKWD